MVTRFLPALPPSLRLRVVGDVVVDDASAEDNGGQADRTVWQVIVTTLNRIARCPCCGRPSRRVHSHYTRTLSDVPCGDRQVRLKLRVRKFFCDSPDCPRSIFAERLPELTTPHARRTCRLDDCLTHLGARPAAKRAHDWHKRSAWAPGRRIPWCD